MISYLLYGLFILACLILVVVILLQPGKSGAGDLFSSNLSSAAFGPRGTASVLAKITIGAAAAFMLIALMLSLPGITGTQSVLQSTEPESQPSPSQQASPAGSAAPASTGETPAGSPAPSVSPSEAKPQHSPAATSQNSPAAKPQNSNAKPQNTNAKPKK